jgi:hypothetical protein
MTDTTADQAIGYSAIRTRYHGPTNTRGLRLTATDGENRTVVNYDYSLGATGNHAAAAQAFLTKHYPYETKLATTAACFGNDFFWTWVVTGPIKEA